MARNNHICKATPEGEQLFDQLWERFRDENSEAAVKRIIEGYGLEYLGQGAKRVALMDIHGQYIQHERACVVKIEKYGETEANEWEHYNYERVGDNVKKYLLPITDFDDDHKWVVVPYVEGEPTERQLFELEKIFVYSGWDVGDVREENVAMVQDKPVLLDYDNKFRRLDEDVMSKEERVELKAWKHGLKE